MLLRERVKRRTQCLYSDMPRLATVVLVVLAFAAVATAGEVIPGPIHAEVVSVYDGDTITVDAHPWPGVTIRTGVRVNGIDTPEIRGKCDAEKEMAREARDLAREVVGASVTLLDVEFGKYAGRVVAGRSRCTRRFLEKKR